MLISYLFASAIIIIPLFSFVLIQVTSDFINPTQYDNLHFRFVKYMYILDSLNFEHLIYALYPDLHNKNQVHSQFLEYVLYYGFFRAIFLIFIIWFWILKIIRIEYLLPVCVIVGLGGALNELFSHWYNSQIIFFYIIFSSLIKENKIRKNK